MPAVIFSGTKVKTLKDTLNLNGGADLLSSTVDPTSVATSANAGSLLLNTSSGLLYRKTDNGSSTNWVLVGIGGATLSVVNKTTTYTALTSDDVITADASSGAFTITLYTASGNTGKVLTLKRTDSSVNAVTIDGSGSETIDGSTTVDLTEEDETIQIVSDGTNWQIIVRSHPENSEVWVYTANGHGSIDNKIKRWTTVGKNVGNAITYADSATLGGTFTINVKGIYSISYAEAFDGVGNLGVSLNSTQRTTNISSITAADRLIALNTTAADRGQCVAFNTELDVNDVIRGHTSGAGDSLLTWGEHFRITKVN